MFSPELQSQRTFSPVSEDSYLDEELEENTYVDIPAFYFNKPYQHIPNLLVSEKYVTSKSIEGKRNSSKIVQYIPLDKRAEWTMKGLLYGIHERILATNSLNELMREITILPNVVFEHILNKLTTIGSPIYVFFSDLIRIKNYVSDLIIDGMSELIFGDLPYVISNGIMKISCAREDILEWYHSNPQFSNIFPKPLEENLWIGIKKGLYDDELFGELVNLSKEEIIGIAFASMIGSVNQDKFLFIQTSLDGPTNNHDVQLVGITINAVTYTSQMNTPEEKIKIPYTVELLINNNFIPINFITLRFMQGITAGLRFLGYPNFGRDIIWRNITKYEGQGYVNISF